MATDLKETLDRTGSDGPGAHPPVPGAGMAPHPTRGWGRAAALVAIAGLVATSVVLRFRAPTGLWLDEVLSVNIARLPLHGPHSLFGALRHDGSPPLYYVLLHVWTRIVGDGDFAVRALSGVFALATLPLAWLVGLRLGGRRAAIAAVCVLGSSPFAVRYATEARMYSLVALLTLAGLAALLPALERPTPLRLLAVAGTSGLLLLTHYWTLYLLATAVAGVGARAVLTRGDERRAALLAVGAVLGGGILFLPWLPTFLFQARHTGTPWGLMADVNTLLDALFEFAGGNTGFGRFLFLFLLGLAVLGAFGHGRDVRHVEIDLRTNPAARPLALGAFVPLILGIGASALIHSTFVGRYAAVSLGPYVLLVALGIATILDRRIFSTVLVAVTLLGFIGAWYASGRERTEAGPIAASIAALARPGDIVAYCPDQLGPAVSRKLPQSIRQIPFPTAGSPDLVDWVDYAERHADAPKFARTLDQNAGDDHDVWVVWAGGYRTFDDLCQTIDRDLTSLRPASHIIIAEEPGRFFEPARLVRYPGTCRRSLEARSQVAICPFDPVTG